MAWVKIPKENHPIFLEALPRDQRVSTVGLFGGVAAKVNGQMFAGLFGRGAIVKISAADQKTALAIDGAEMFDPMGNGRVVADTVLLPESVLIEPDDLRVWLGKALDYTASLPSTKRRPTAKPAGRPPAAKHPSKRSLTTKVRQRAG